MIDFGIDDSIFVKDALIAIQLETIYTRTNCCFYHAIEVLSNDGYSVLLPAVGDVVEHRRRRRGTLSDH
jgi:hypothetical protein